MPDSLREIGDRAFEWCLSLESVHLPDSLEKISTRAFSTCYSLHAINFPDNLREIGNAAFQMCRCLRSVHLPDSLKRIGADAFNDCLTLQSINIPKNVEHIGLRVLNDCNSLTTVNVEHPSYYVQDTLLISSDGYIVSYWGEGNTLTFPEGVTCLYGHVSGSCKTLRIPHGLTKIVDEDMEFPVFPNNAIQSIIIPKGSRNTIARLYPAHRHLEELLVEE